MKFEINKDTFLDKLNLASRFTSDKITASTTLQGIYLKGDKETIHIYATNLNMYYHAKLKVSHDEAFDAVLEPRKIIEFLQFLQAGNVTFEIKDKQVTISQGRTKGNFPLFILEEFPTPPVMGDEPQELEADFLTKKLPLVLFNASSDEARPVLTGINFIVSDEEFLMVSTDGFRLSLVKDQRKGSISSMIIPADFLSEVMRNMKDEKKVNFSYSETEKIVCFQVKDDSFYSRLIEGAFPPYERVIPPETHTTITVEKDELLRNVKLISVFARDFSNVVVASFKDGELSMRPKKEGNSENQTVQEVEMKGEAQTVAFNFKYLLDFLNHVATKTLTIDIVRSDAPVVFRIKNDPSFMHIIMPVRIQEE